MGMGIRVYPLSSGDEDETKIVYLLSLGMWLRMNFYCGDGNGIMKCTPIVSCSHP